MNVTKFSKKLSLVLRHKPEAAGIGLDTAGWANVKDLLAGIGFNKATLEHIVETDEKQRYAFNKSGTKIRAVQGHSVKVDLGLVPVKPPDTLYHGTARRNLRSILQDGLVSGERNYVHLSGSEEIAQQVGSRHGKPVVLFVWALGMYDSGYQFYKAENGVWLTAHVLPVYIAVDYENF